MWDRKASSCSALVSCSHAPLLSAVPPVVLRSRRATAGVVSHMLPAAMTSCVLPASASSTPQPRPTHLSCGGPTCSTSHAAPLISHTLPRGGVPARPKVWRCHRGVLSCPPQATYANSGGSSNINEGADAAGSTGGDGLSSSYRTLGLDIPKYQSMGFIAADPATRDSSSKWQNVPPPLSVAYPPIVPLSSRMQPAVDGSQPSRLSTGSHVLSSGMGGTKTVLLGGADDTTDLLDVIDHLEGAGVIQVPLTHQDAGRDGSTGGTDSASAGSSSSSSSTYSHTASQLPPGDRSWGLRTLPPRRNEGVEDEALSRQRAEDALSKADSSLDNIEKLQYSAAASDAEGGAAPGWQGLLGGSGATSRYNLSPILRAARELVIVGVLSVSLLMSHAFGIWVQMMAAVVVAGAIAGWGYKRGALSRSGAIAAALVGVATLSCSLRMGATLVAFFFTSSKLTHYKEAMKANLDDSSKKGGQRDWVQVACNGLVPSCLAVAYGVWAGCVDVPLGVLPALEPWRAQCLTGLMGAFLGYYACCCGDTWASELGPLSQESPRLITTGREVPKGTNGGVTILGLSASILGGMLIGLVFYLSGLFSPTLWVFKQQQTMAVGQWRLIPLGLMAGLLGSVLDSLFGATLQYSGRNVTTGKITSRPGPDVEYISGKPLLTNNHVNLLSASMTAALTASIAMHMFGV